MEYRANMSPSALAAWDSLVQKYGDLKVNSAYRSPEHNKRVGGAKHSQHTHGNAFDVDVSGVSRAERLALIEQARASGFKGIGVYDNALHFDVGPDRAWGSDYTRNSLPEWAGGAVSSPVVASGPVPAPQTPQNALAAFQRPPMASNMLDPRAFMTARAPINKLAFT